MIKRFHGLLAITFFFLSLSVSAQNSNVTVDTYTGASNVEIPLYNVQSGSLSLPVKLSYRSSGVRVKDAEGSAGMNWNLIAGGSIEREVRGLPDDCRKNTLNQTRLGWLNNTNGTKINSFNIANDNNTATCTDETADINYINSNFSDLSDTEPDIFYVSAPGLNFKLVFDNTHAIRTIPYQDVKVTYTLDAGGNINSFTVINDKGVKYVFSDYETTIRHAYTTNPNNVNYLKLEYSQYTGGGLAQLLTSGISYNSSWHLTSMTDPNGNFINLNYISNDDQPNYIPYITSVDSLNLVVAGASETSTKQFQYEIASRVLTHQLFSIHYGHGTTSYLGLSFAYGPPNLRIIKSITGYGKVYNFDYVNPYSIYPAGGYSPNNKFYLSGINTVDSYYECTNPDSYTFSYNGITFYPDDPNLYNPGKPLYTVAIPDSNARQVDYWGYYNGTTATTLTPQLYINPSNAAYERYRSVTPTNSISSYPYLLTGADRSANPSYVINGMLGKITYANGGTTTLTYESNDFYDPTAGAVVQGGGVRVKQITDYDGINTANNMVKSYSYIDGVSNHSSGKLISMPVFAFTVPYTGSGSALDQWNYSTVRSEDNLSPEQSSVVYSFVKETRVGAGSTVYEYRVPATNWDNSASPDWAPTVNNFARPTCTSAGFMANATNTYPFTPNTNFDFERGLINKVSMYDDAGHEVAETVYNYIRSNAPIVITGLKFDVNSGLTTYAKYKLYATTSELRTQEINKVFDAQAQNQSQQTTVNYTYNSSKHKLATQQQVTNSDGSVENTYFKYAKDYTPTLGTDSTANGIYHLQKMSINAPVEQYSQVVQGGTTKTVTAQLIKYKTFNPTGSAYQFMPFQKLQFRDNNGVADFTPSASSTVFTYDSRYIPVENDLAYDFGGILLSKDDNYKNVQSIITDHKSMASVAAIKNARYDEIAYNDFNSDIADVGFARQSGANTYIANSHSGQFALSLEASVVMSKILNKSPLAKKYVFSIWINSAAAGNLAVTVTSTSSTSQTTNMAYANTSGAWKYYEVSVPVTSMTATFTAQFQSSTAINVDDILFYPDAAEVGSIAYDPATFMKTAETNTNGVSTYYQYDNFNRLKLVLDQDKNIITQKRYYFNSATYIGLTDLHIQYNAADLVQQQPATFTIRGFPPCLEDQVTASWNFGDGTPAVAGFSPTHAYSSYGNFTITVTLTSTVPFMTSKTLSLPVQVLPPPPQPIQMFIVHNTTAGQITNISFSQAGQLVYSFNLYPTADPLPYTILQGEYDVKISYVKSGPAFKSISYTDSGGLVSGCFPNTSTSPVTIHLNLTNSPDIYFSIDTTTCLL